VTRADAIVGTRRAEALGRRARLTPSPGHGSTTARAWTSTTRPTSCHRTLTARRTATVHTNEVRLRRARASGGQGLRPVDPGPIASGGQKLRPVDPDTPGGPIRLGTQPCATRRAPKARSGASLHDGKTHVRQRVLSHPQSVGPATQRGEGAIRSPGERLRARTVADSSTCDRPASTRSRMTSIGVTPRRCASA
jgi:hypothetical protein